MIVFSNMLTAGCVPAIKRRLKATVVVTLQGDDIFLNDLIEPYRSQALEAIRGLDASVDAYLVNSRFYADAMSEYLSLPREKFRIVPLGIDTQEFVVRQSLHLIAVDKMAAVACHQILNRENVHGALAHELTALAQ